MMLSGLGLIVGLFLVELFMSFVVLSQSYRSDELYGLDPHFVLLRGEDGVEMQLQH